MTIIMKKLEKYGLTFYHRSYEEITQSEFTRAKPFFLKRVSLVSTN